MNYKKFAIISFSLVIVIGLFAALNAHNFYFRLDLSRDQAFSISEYSRDLLRSLPDNVELTYFLSARLETRLPAVQEISDILFEYQRISRGAFNVTIVDPESSPENPPEDFGISPRELQIVENNEQTFARVYSGMVLSYRDSTEVIPLIVNSSNIEYEVTSRLLTMTEDRQRNIALVIAKADSNPQNFQTMLQFLNQYYDIQVVQVGEPIPPSAQGLVVFGMAQLDEGDLYGIEQFILSGKGVIIATESAEVDLQQGITASDQSDHPLLDMLAHYGVTIGNSWVLDESNLLVPIQQQQGRVIINTYQSYPQWVQLLNNYAATNHPLTSRFQGLDLFWASPITLDSGLESSTVLFSSSPNSVLGNGYVTDYVSAQNAILQLSESDGSYPLVVSIEDGLNAWFAEPPAQLSERSISYPNPLTQSEETRLLIVGDSDFPTEIYQASDSSYNILIMQSVLEYLVGDEALLEIRTRGLRNTRLDALEEPSFNTVILLARIYSFGILPISIVLYALIRHNKRRKKSKLPFIKFSN